jgi:hypothetical protein
LSSYATNDELILVDPVEDEDVEEFVHGLILQTSDNARSKENKDYHSSDHYCLIITLAFMAWQLN